MSAGEPEKAHETGRDAAEPKPEVTVAEAGRLGGCKVREQYGSDFFGEIGRKGGSTTRSRHGSEHYAEIGRKGGRKTKERHGTEFYGAIGRLGGRRAQGAADEPPVVGDGTPAD